MFDRTKWSERDADCKETMYVLVHECVYNGAAYRSV